MSVAAVADTTPLNYLVLIGEIDLLSILYRRVLIPHEVHRELQHAKAPAVVRYLALQLSVWCEVDSSTFRCAPRLGKLGAGERDAIQLALERGVETVLMDEREGRREAKLRNLTVTGTLRILELAGWHGLIDFRAALQRLEKTSFRLSSEIRDDFLRRNP